MAKKGICRKACEFIQLYAKLRDSDDTGGACCCSCSEWTVWGKAHGGHFQPKGRHYNAASFEEDNVHFQCSTCNIYRGGNPAGYMKFMLEVHGEDVIEYIKEQSYKTLENAEIQEIAEVYKQKCRDLAKTKGFVVKWPSGGAIPRN